jgi:MFS family permease
MVAFGLTYTQAGALMTVFFTTSGAGQAAAGFLVDRVGAARVLAACMAAYAAAAFVVAAAGGYGGLVAAAVLAGLANGGFHPADFTLLNRHVSPPRLGHAFSVHGLSGYLGWAGAPVFMAGLAGLAGWRAAAAGAGGVALAALGVLLACRRALLDSAAAALPRAGDAVSAGGPFAFLGLGAVWTCFLFFLVSTMATGALSSFAPSVLQTTHGLTLAAATAALSLYLLGGALGMIGGGVLAARSEAHDRHIAVALCAAALTAVALAIGAVPARGVALAMVVLGCCTGVAGPSRDLLVRRTALERCGEGAFGRIYGFVYSGLDVGGAVAPLVFGRLLDHGLFREVLAGVAILQVLAVATALQVGRSRRVPAPRQWTPGPPADIL